LFGIDKGNEAGDYASAPPAVVEAKTGEKKKKRIKVVPRLLNLKGRRLSILPRKRPRRRASMP
jgi:hypothetical protein